MDTQGANQGKLKNKQTWKYLEILNIWNYQ